MKHSVIDGCERLYDHRIVDISRVCHVFNEPSPVCPHSETFTAASQSPTPEDYTKQALYCKLLLKYGNSHNKLMKVKDIYVFYSEYIMYNVVLRQNDSFAGR